MKSLLTAFALLFTLTTLRAEETKTSADVYLALHGDALVPSSPTWKNTMEKLLQLGDAFTLECLKNINTANLNADFATVLASVVEATKKRIAVETDADFVKHIETWLKSAALADVTCNPLETTLPAWALKIVRENIERPGVRTELARIKSESSAPQKTDSLEQIANDRLKKYVERILTAKSADSVGGATIPGSR